MPYYTPTPVIPQGRNIEVDTIVLTAWEDGIQIPRRVTVSIPVHHIHRFSEDIDIQSIPVIEESSG